VANPLRLSETPVEYGPSPLLGQHTDDVLTAAGLSTDEIAGYRAAGVL